MNKEELIAHVTRLWEERDHAVKRCDEMREQMLQLPATERKCDDDDNDEEWDDDDREQLRALSQQYPALYEGLVGFTCYGLRKSGGARRCRFLARTPYGLRRGASD